VALDSTRASWRAVYTKLKVERVLIHNVIVGGGTIFAGVLGVAFQALVSHRLQPAAYGGVFTVVTLISLIGLPGSAFTLLMAREASRFRAQGGQTGSAALLQRGNKVLLLAGTAAAGALASSSPLLARFLGVQPELLLAAAAGIPFAFAFPFLMGEFQGEQQFVFLSLFGVSQALLKLIAAIALGAVFGPVGIIAGISFASVVAYVLAYVILRQRVSIDTPGSLWRPAVAYLAVVIPSTIAIAVLLSADVLLVKHYFSAQAAGEYAAVAALGRAIFWGANGVSIVLFPKASVRTARRQSSSNLVVASLMLVGLGGLFGFGVLSVASTWLLTAFAGAAYAGAAGYLPWYALGMTLLGGVSVLIAIHQSKGRPGFLILLVPLTLLEPTLIIAFHQTLIQVIQVVDLSVGLTFVGLGSLFVIQDRSGGTETELGVAITAAHVVGQQLTQ
jgi:O-antigen/teichoic acid export membrane protein